VICIFNKKGETFLFRDFGRNIGWELPGGYVYEGEKIEDAVNRIVLRETGLTVNELEPIFLLRNVFCYKDKCKNHIHKPFCIIFHMIIRQRRSTY
jgi:ADP-ribose pyrophosphatase YjhB (NUDIX family)